MSWVILKVHYNSGFTYILLQSRKKCVDFLAAFWIEDKDSSPFFLKKKKTHLLEVLKRFWTEVWQNKNIYKHTYIKLLDFTFYREYFCLSWQKRNFWHLVLCTSHIYVWNCFTVHEGLISRAVTILCVYHRLSCAGIQWIQTVSSWRRIRYSQRVEKHCYLAPACFVHPLHVSQLLIARPRKEKEEQNWLSFLPKYKHENVHQPTAAWSISGNTPTWQLLTKQLDS